MNKFINKLTVNPDGKLSFADRTIDCALGRGGRRLQKAEGDGATPVGVWALKQVYYRPDRLAEPDSDLGVSALSETDGWCDDPDHADYNRLVTLPHAASCEKLWRNDHVYDVIVTLGHNDDPVVSGAGSAIFFHLARKHLAREGFEPTEGCVAVTLADMLYILAHLKPGCVMDIQAAG